MDEIPRNLVEVAERLKSGELPRRHRVRSVLKWFGASRRGANVLSDVQTALATLELRTDPPFDDAGIDELVQFVLVAPQAGDRVTSEEPLSGQGTATDAARQFTFGRNERRRGGKQTFPEDQLRARLRGRAASWSNPTIAPSPARVRIGQFLRCETNLTRGSWIFSPNSKESTFGILNRSYHPV